MVGIGSFLSRESSVKLVVALDFFLATRDVGIRHLELSIAGDNPNFLSLGQPLTTSFLKSETMSLDCSSTHTSEGQLKATRSQTNLADPDVVRSGGSGLSSVSYHHMPRV